MKYRHIFGPVPSRRLGFSLGIDLVPLKTCTFNCIYCECGETTDLTVERKNYVPLKEVLKELEDYLEKKPQLDYITFSGSGEPTLHAGIGEVVDFIKDNYPGYRLCLLTNSALLNNEAVRAQIKRVDLIIPSLDAATENTFQQINRPDLSIKCEQVIEGLIKLRHEYSGEIWLEIFIVPGLNDTSEELVTLKKAIGKIKPDLVQVGTLDRPGAEEWVEPADQSKMEEIASFLKKAEPIGKFEPGQKLSAYKSTGSSQILHTLKRRPCTAEDLYMLLNLRPVEIQKNLNRLLARGIIESEQKERGLFFKIKKGPEDYY